MPGVQTRRTTITSGFCSPAASGALKFPRRARDSPPIILTAEGAELRVQHDVSCVIVWNHVGRQLYGWRNYARTRGGASADDRVCCGRIQRHEQRAVASAFNMLDRFDKLKDRWSTETNLPLDFVDIGIGLVTDKVILGTSGSDTGVRDFTAIGTPVNLDAFFEQQARDGRRILTDGMTYRAVQHTVDASQRPGRGRSAPISMMF